MSARSRFTLIGALAVGLALIALVITAALGGFAREIPAGPGGIKEDLGTTPVRPDIRRRTEVDPDPKRSGPQVAAKRNVRFRIVDATTDQPLAGARLYSARGPILARTDLEGFATVVDARIDAMVFGADGYLVEHFFERPAVVRRMLARRVAGEAIEVALRPDEFTVPGQLRFLDPRGTLVGEVTFEVTALDQPIPTAGTVPIDRTGARTVQPKVREAWQRHALLSTMQRPDFNPELLHFGAQSHGRTFVCQGVAAMRFLAGGTYRVEARSGSLTARTEIELHAAAKNHHDVRMHPGVFAVGRVIAETNNAPVVGAQVVLRRGNRIATSGETDREGRFRLGPMSTDSVRLEVQHPEFLPLEEPRLSPGADRIYRLRSRPMHAIRGTVRRGFDRRAVAAAKVRLTGGMGVMAEGVTDAAGKFELRSVLTEPTLEVAAKGFLAYEEMIHADGATLLVDLVPATVAARRQAGLTAVVAGRVRDAKGRPVANCPVQLRPETPWIPSGIAGRRIIRGGQVPFRQMVVTDANGRFELEWTRAEPVRLVAAGGPLQGKAVSVRLGQRHEVDLRAESRKN